MVVDQGNEMQRLMMNGWPFGLGNMNSRIIVRSTDDYARPAPPPPQPYAPSRFTRSLSFSSFSSSNLDTESTASFFPDQSMSLGRLIGIKSTATKKRSCLYHELCLKDQETAAASNERSAVSTGPPSSQNSQGLCVPLLHHVVEKISRSKSSYRH